MTLRQVLLTGLEDVVHFGKTFSRYQQHPDGTVTAFYEDGTSAPGDLLVGADGTSSGVRRQYLPRARLEESGIIGIAGKLPLTREARHLLPEKAFHGVSMIMAPRGYSCIVHVMEFPWDRDGVKPGIGTTDEALIERWPGLLFDNTTDYLMWGLSAPASRLPKDIMARQGEDLLPIAAKMTQNWHPHLRTMIALTNPSTYFPLNIRTSVPVAPWPSSNVTLLGDAIHTMTPGRGVGANTALRDASLLCQNLIAVREGRLELIGAVQDYEARMREYAYAAVVKSREQMDGNGLIHKPVIGRVVLGGMRAGMRVANRLPLGKRRMIEGLQQERGTERNRVVSAAT